MRRRARAGGSASGLGIPLGFVTDRDIVVEVTATDLDPNTMTGRRHRARQGRTPPTVLTEDGRLVGLVAFDALLVLLKEQLSDLTKLVDRERKQHPGRDMPSHRRCVRELTQRARGQPGESHLSPEICVLYGRN
jgi:hypothetical protein